MSSPRISEYRRIDEYPEMWEVKESVLNGDEFVIRVCSGLEDAVGHPAYSYQIGIAVPLNFPTKPGFANEQESVFLKELELNIEREVESKSTRLAGVLSGRNMKEFILYTSEPEIAEEKIKKITENTKSHKLQYVIQSDPEWNTYKFIANK